MNKIVPKGQDVTFFCDGFGSSVSISWQYDNVCSDCGRVVLNATDLTVFSTLTIDTSQLAVDTFQLQCVLHQNVSVRMVADKVFSTRLTITMPSKFNSIVVTVIIVSITHLGSTATVTCDISTFPLLFWQGKVL